MQSEIEKLQAKIQELSKPKKSGVELGRASSAVELRRAPGSAHNLQGLGNLNLRLDSGPISRISSTDLLQSLRHDSSSISRISSSDLLRSPRSSLANSSVYDQGDVSSASDPV